MRWGREDGLCGVTVIQQRTCPWLGDVKMRQRRAGRLGVGHVAAQVRMQSRGAWECTVLGPQERCPGPAPGHGVDSDTPLYVASSAQTCDPGVGAVEGGLSSLPGI